MTDTMHAIVKDKPEPGIVFKEVPVPEIKENEVLIKVRANSLCGTDVHIYKWDPWAQSRIKTPLIIGHEIAGEVVKVGSLVKRVKIGDHVSLESHIPCNHCKQCLMGQKHICANVKILGVDVNGGLAD